MNPTSTRTLAERLSKPDFPRSSRYDPHWLLNNVMGPHVLWLTEWLSQSLELTPGMRVLDLGWADLARREAEMLRIDDGRTFGFTRVIARRPMR